MVSLKDIAKIKRGEEFIELRGEKLPARGLSAEQIVNLFHRFPAIEKAFSGGGVDDEEIKITGASLVKAVPEAMGIIATMGTFCEGDKEQEQGFMELEVHEQIKVLNKIMELTFGENWAPLVSKAKAWFDAKLGDDGENKNDRGGPGKVRDMESLKQLRSSLRSATTPEMFGGTHQGNSPDTPS